MKGCATVARQRRLAPIERPRTPWLPVSSLCPRCRRVGLRSETGSRAGQRSCSPTASAGYIPRHRRRLRLSAAGRAVSLPVRFGGSRGGRFGIGCARRSRSCSSPRFPECQTLGIGRWRQHRPRGEDVPAAAGVTCATAGPGACPSRRRPRRDWPGSGRQEGATARVRVSSAPLFLAGDRGLHVGRAAVSLTPEGMRG
jgi:hypothetical protein